MILFIINDAPYGTEKAYNALRLGISIRKNFPEKKVNVFLMGDAVSCALPNQKTPTGYYNIEKMIRILLNKEVVMHACGTCMEARGLEENSLIRGVQKSNLMTLTEWTVNAEKVLTF